MQRTPPIAALPIAALPIAALSVATLILAACSGDDASGVSQPSTRPLAVGDVWTWQTAHGAERRLMIVGQLGNEYEVQTTLGETTATIMSGRHLDDTVQTKIGRAASSLRNTIWQLRPDPLGVPLTGLRDVQLPKDETDAAGAPATLGRRPQDLAEGVRAYPSRGPFKYQPPKESAEAESSSKKKEGPEPKFLSAVERTTELVDHDPELRWRGQTFESVEDLVEAVHKRCATTSCQIAILGSAPQSNLAVLADAFLDRGLDACVAIEPARPRPWRTGQVWAMPTDTPGATVAYTVDGVHEDLFGGSYARLAYRRKTSANVPDAFRTLVVEQKPPEVTPAPALTSASLDAEPVAMLRAVDATNPVVDPEFARYVADCVHQLETLGRVTIPIRVRQDGDGVVATMGPSSNDMSVETLADGVGSAANFPFPILFEVQGPELDRDLLYPVLALLDAGATPWRLSSNTPEPPQTAAPGSPALAPGQVWTWQHPDGDDARLSIVGRAGEDFVIEQWPSLRPLRMRVTEWNLSRTVRNLVGFRRTSSPGTPPMIAAPISKPLAGWDAERATRLLPLIKASQAEVTVEEELPEANVAVERAQIDSSGTWQWRNGTFSTPADLANAVRSADVPVQLVLLGDNATLDHTRILVESDVGAVLAPKGSEAAVAAGDIWSLELPDEGVTVELEVAALGADILVGPTVDLRPLPIEGVERSRITHIRVPAKTLLHAGARKVRSVEIGERLADEVLEGPLRSRDSQAQLRESVAVYAQLVLHGEARPMVTLAMAESGLVARLFGIDTAADTAPNYMAALGDKVEYPMVYQIDAGTAPQPEVDIFLNRLAEFGVPYALKKK